MLSALLAHGRPADEPAALIYDGTLPTQETIVGTLDEIVADGQAARTIGAPAILVVGRVVGAARAPALVRRAAAVRQADPGHAAARAGRRARRAARVARAPKPIEAPMIRIVAARRLRAARRGVRAQPARFDWIVFSSANAVDAFMRAAARPRRSTCARSAGVKLCAVGPATAERLARYGLKVDLDARRVPRRSGRARAIAKPATLAGSTCCCRAPTSAARWSPTSCGKQGADVTEVDRLPDGGRRAGARGRARHLPHAARAAHRRRDVHERRRRCAISSRALGAEPAADLLRTTVVASIGPVTAEAAAQYDIHTTIMPAQYTMPALVDAIVDSLREASHDTRPATHAGAAS